MSSDPDRTPVRIGISSCLLGRAVRYDGGERRNDFLVARLGPFVRWVDVCPEVEIGLGIPRPPIRLERRGDGLRLTMPSTGADLTGQMRAYAAARTAELADAGLCGFVLKSRSPSCGPAEVEVLDPHEGVRPSGRGLFAEALILGLPDLPVEDESRLEDPRVRENFVAAAFARRRWLETVAGGLDVRSLRSFHRRHEALLESRQPGADDRLGQTLARADAGTAHGYRCAFFQVMRRVPGPEDHARVLRREVERSAVIGSVAKAELEERVEAYLAGSVPLSDLLDRVRRLAVDGGDERLRRQVYLRPHPPELGLLDRV